MINKTNRSFAAAVLLSASFLTRAQAQQNQEELVTLPELVVTGDLWESELQSNPTSISVLDSTTLSNPELLHLDDISGLIPNLTGTGGTSRTRYFQIRGIGENSQFEGETPDSAVSFQIDDLDFTGLGGVGTLLDVSQVEVLRGPQAGAFGANAAGGIIRIVSNDPTPYQSGHLKLNGGSDALIGGELAAGGTLSGADPETLMYRFAIQHNQSNGFHENEFLNRDDTNERNETAARLKLRWNANDSNQWDATIFYANFDNGYDVFSLGNIDFKTFSNEPGRDEQESIGLSLKGQVELSDNLELTTKSAYMSSDSLYSYDADWTDASYAGFLSILRDRKVLTQEIRIDSDTSSSNRWTAGIYLQTLDEDTEMLYRDGDPSAGEFGFGQVDVVSNYQTDTLALFGQHAWTISEMTRLIVGLRYELHDVAFDSSLSEQGYYQGSLTEGSAENDDSVLGGKITLEHNLNENSLLFGSFARGYKAGGANSATFTAPGFPLTYEQETLWNIEAGIKNSLAENRIFTQITAFYLHRENPQLRDSVGAGGFFRYLTVNGETANHFGMEAEMQWAIDENWRLYGGLSFLDAERESYTDPGGFVPSRELSNAPTYSYNIRLSYLNPDGLFGALTFIGKDSYFESNSHLEERDSVNLVHLTSGYTWRNWKFSVWVKNLFDTKYASRVFLFDNGEGEQRYEALSAPRQIGSTVTWSF